ncbi:MAG: ribulose-phosphate 3-epimerase [Ruminococcus sp.]|nr:ribulose-phosphate 3-epimerase [Ruminococcus sp.]
MKNSVSASVLSADMLRLGEEIEKLERNGIEMLHFDVMDGMFVNNITFGFPVLEKMRRKTGLVMDVHLMIADPLKYVRRFAENADIISFHIESDSDTMQTINAVRECGVKVALAIKPDTPAEAVYKYLPYLDMVLVMTVEPGFGGQSFMDMSEKIRLIRDRITESGLDIDIQVDGGINAETAETVKKAGANVFVSGSYLFRADDMKKTADILRAEIC